MGPEVAYENFEFEDAATNCPGPDCTRPFGIVDEDEVWGAMFRLQRDF
jgi:hypothetical protein